MYQEDKYNINWFKIGLRLVIVLLVLVLSIKLVSLVVQNRSETNRSNVMMEKLKEFDKVGKKYFEDKVPEASGDVQVITLQELIDNKFIEEIKDTEDKVCNSKESSVKITKLDSEYQIKTTLICDNYEDYINSFINIENVEIPVEPTTTVTTTTTAKKTTTTTTTKVTTTRVTTTTAAKKKYTVSFNSNGGNPISPQSIEENGTIVEMKPIRAGYKFIGWFYHGEPFDLNTKVNQDYVLTAKWVRE